MRLLLVIFSFVCFHALSQSDKIFLRNGEVKKVIVVSIGNDYVFYRTNDASSVEKYAKSNVILVEKYDGKVFVFGEKTLSKDSTSSNLKLFRNSIGMQPFNVLVGRYTFTYERLNKDASIGYVIPLSITFDPVGSLYAADTSRKTASQRHRAGINFITGADVNFYIGKNDFEGFYIGPRVRYGVDMFLSNLEGYTIQTQFGWKLNDPEDRLNQHVSVGVGFVRVLSSPAGNRVGAKQSFGWASINYRIGFNW